MESKIIQLLEGASPSAPSFPNVPKWQDEFSKAFVSSFKIEKSRPDALTIFDSLGRDVVTISLNYELKTDMPFFVVQLGEKYEDAYFPFLNNFEGMYVSMPETKVALFIHALANKMKSQAKSSPSRFDELGKQWEDERFQLFKQGVKVS